MSGANAPRAAVLSALIAGALVSAASLTVLARMVDGRRGETPAERPALTAPGGGDSPGTLGHEIRALERKKVELSRRLERLRPRGVWVLIDTGANRISLMNGDRVVREAVCSTGSGTLLEDPASGRKWVFNTPRGEFRILEKKTDPVWVKPDWAFIEEGKPVPASFRERIERDTLGDYALDLGDGYLIHGTLFQRSLGLSVTHGCVRVGDTDLALIYRAVRKGTRVYIV